MQDQKFLDQCASDVALCALERALLGEMRTGDSNLPFEYEASHLESDCEIVTDLSRIYIHSCLSNIKSIVCVLDKLVFVELNRTVDIFVDRCEVVEFVRIRNCSSKRSWFSFWADECDLNEGSTDRDKTSEIFSRRLV